MENLTPEKLPEKASENTTLPSVKKYVLKKKYRTEYECAVQN